MAHNSAQRIIWNLAEESRSLLNVGNNYKRRRIGLRYLQATLAGKRGGWEGRGLPVQALVSWVERGKTKIAEEPRGELGGARGRALLLGTRRGKQSAAGLCQLGCDKDAVQWGGSL